MLDRQDLDALLVSALYGELTPADEARLAAHLESHPADRGALDGMKLTREAVRESRIFAVQVDPPQALSALLLQEAARRAPKRNAIASEDGERVSWFQRFVRSFVMHPAMAAAAMFVFVAGVAGTLYIKNGAEQPSQLATSKEAIAAEAPEGGAVARQQAVQPQGVVANGSAAAPTAAAAAQPAAGSAYGVDLAAPRDVAPGAPATGALEGESQTTVGFARAKAEPKMKIAEHATAAPAKKASKPYLELEQNERAPKEMAKSGGDRADDDQLAAATQPADGTSRNYASYGKGAGGGGAVNGPQGAPPAAPPPPPMATPAPAPAKTAPSASFAADKADRSTDRKAVAKDSSSSDLAWAKGQHDQIVRLAAAGQCSDAATAATALRNRAPDYYAQYVASDIRLKKCAPYFTDAAEREAEKNAKARPAKRANADETQQLK